MMMRTHRVVERFVRSCGSATGTASACRRCGRHGCRMIATAGCASTTDWRLRLRNNSAATARGTATFIGNRRHARSTTASASGRCHGHHRSTTGTSAASAGLGHHAHHGLLHPLPIVAGVNDRVVVAVHCGFVAMFALRLGLAMSVMTTAVAGHLTFVATAALAAVGLASTAPLALEELAQAALLLAASLRSAALVAAGMLAGVTADRADDQQQSAGESQGGLHDVPQDAVASGGE